MAHIDKYGLAWAQHTVPLFIEMEMVRRGGKVKSRRGTIEGNGVEWHFREAIKLIWPDIVFNKWMDLFITNFLTKRTVVVLGPASSGKSFDAACCGLMDYFCFPTSTTGIYCSTTRERLEDRIWGEVKGLHKQAKHRYPWLAGHMIESRQRIITNSREDAEEGRDFRNGLVGVAVQRGDSFVGLGSFIGIKNKRVRLYGDELQLLPKAFVESISNLDKNHDFIAVGMGNPKDTTDALGTLAEPAAHLGGWEGGIDQEPITKSWDIRRHQGICLQFVGSDSPNLDGKLGIPLLTQEAIDRDVSFYGKDSIQYTMMNQGMMPRGQGSRRVITRQLCDKFGAREQPFWASPNRTKGASLDAAYRGVGGDRCILKFFEFGSETATDQNSANGDRLVTGSIAAGPSAPDKRRQIFSITETMLVPIKNDANQLPEDQISTFVMEQCISRGVAPENFFYEAGMRTVLTQSFCRIWSNKTQSIDCMGKPTERKVSYDIDVRCCDHYSKFVTELWFSVRYMVEARQYRGMTEGAVSEFSSREWGYVGQNKIEIEPKAKMKLKTGRSPDEADCEAIAVEGARRLGFVIKRLQAEVEVVKDDKWKRDAKDRAKKFWKAGQLTAT